MQFYLLLGRLKGFFFESVYTCVLELVYLIPYVTFISRKALFPRMVETDKPTLQRLSTVPASDISIGKIRPNRVVTVYTSIQTAW